MVKNQEIISLLANNYLFKANNRNTRKKIWNVQSYVNDVVLMFLLLTLTKFHTFFSSVSIVESEQKLFGHLIQKFHLHINSLWAFFQNISLDLSTHAKTEDKGVIIF